MIVKWFYLNFMKNGQPFDMLMLEIVGCQNLVDQ